MIAMSPFVMAFGSISPRVSIAPIVIFKAMTIPISVNAAPALTPLQDLRTSLNAASRIILCFIMFFGRLGPLTIIGVVNKNWLGASKRTQLPDNRAIISELGYVIALSSTEDVYFLSIDNAYSNVKNISTYHDDDYKPVDWTRDLS